MAWAYIYQVWIPKCYGPPPVGLLLKTQPRVMFTRYVNHARKCNSKSSIPFFRIKGPTLYKQSCCVRHHSGDNSSLLILPSFSTSTRRSRGHRFRMVVHDRILYICPPPAMPCSCYIVIRHQVWICHTKSNKLFRGGWRGRTCWYCTNYEYEVQAELELPKGRNSHQCPTCTKTEADSISWFQCDSIVLGPTDDNDYDMKIASTL